MGTEIRSQSTLQTNWSSSSKLSKLAANSAPLLGPYAPQGSMPLLPKLSVTSKVDARTSCPGVGSRVHFRSSDDVILLEFTSPVDREYVGSFIESKTSVVQTSNVGFTSEVSDYLVVHTGPGSGLTRFRLARSGISCVTGFGTWPWLSVCLGQATSGMCGQSDTCPRLLQLPSPPLPLRFAASCKESH